MGNDIFYMSFYGFFRSWLKSHFLNASMNSTILQLFMSKPEEFHLISLVNDTLLLLLFGFLLFISNSVLLIKIFNEFQDTFLFFGSLQIASYVLVVYWIEKSEKRFGGEIWVFDVKLCDRMSTDWTSCWLILDSHSWTLDE